MLFSKYKFDVFVSHAVEDKLPIANDLCKRLEESGLRVWYSSYDLQAGDSIDTTIRRDLSKSRHAVVILSPHYLVKQWTMREYYMLQAQEKAGRKVILPVLYDITADDLKNDLYMADKFAIPYLKGMDFVISKLLEVINGVKPPRPQLCRKSFVKRMGINAAILSVVLIASYFLYASIAAPAKPDSSFIAQTIEQRINNYQTKIESVMKLEISNRKGRPAEQSEIITQFVKFSNLKTYYRNEYEFSNSYKEVRSKKNIERDLRLNLDELTVSTAYGFTNYKSFLTPLQKDGLVNTLAFAFINDKPLGHDITDSKVLENGDYQVTVTYTNNIRSVFVNLVFPAENFPKRYQVSMSGFLPVENYVFRQVEGVWSLSALQ